MTQGPRWILILVAVAALFACGSGDRPKARKVMVLGVDGMDPKLIERFVAAGDLPNIEKLISLGDFKPLQTTMPPLSPVAWSSFLTGMDPGGHAVFDFVHRDPITLLPEFSLSRTHPPEWTVDIGSWVIPLSGGKVEALRKGKPFWSELEENGVTSTVFRMPANFPPEGPGRSFSGMGTPDILGTPGTFSYFTNRVPENVADISGGEVFEVSVDGNHVSAELTGPANAFRTVEVESQSVFGGGGTRYENPPLTIPFDVYIDKEGGQARILIQDHDLILRVGEWSDWVSVGFDAVPYLATVSAVGRFYLQEIDPGFRLYVTPLQISSKEPAMPISSPDGWASEIQKEIGYFYTQELPEDTKAFSSRLFSGMEFWKQAQFIFRERERALDYFLESWEDGFLFFYFSSIDQSSHMLWQYMDPAHPGHEQHEILSDAIRTLYRQLDVSVGKIMDKLDDDTTFIIMSDHGFSPFYWGVNLNSWLVEKGYVSLVEPSQQGQHQLYQNVDWPNTEAYALGLNGLYVNLRGRERRGIVREGEAYERLLDRLEADLLAMEDPRNGNHPVSLVIRTKRDFVGQATEGGPDIIVGYSRGYRSSWESPLGEFPNQLFVDNTEAWSGDHSIDAREVPGVLIANRMITLDNPGLPDLTVSILDEYGISKTEVMIGRDTLAGRDSARAQKLLPPNQSEKR